MMILLPSFNLTGGKGRVKLLRNFHLTKVKQNFLLFLRVWLFMNFSKKIYNKRDNRVI